MVCLVGLVYLAGNGNIFPLSLLPGVLGGLLRSAGGEKKKRLNRKGAPVPSSGATGQEKDAKIEMREVGNM